MKSVDMASTKARRAQYNITNFAMLCLVIFLVFLKSVGLIKVGWFWVFLPITWPFVVGACIICGVLSIMLIISLGAFTVEMIDHLIRN